MSEKTEPCLACGGTGRSVPPYDVSGLRESCINCRGTGRVPVGAPRIVVVETGTPRTLAEILRNPANLEEPDKSGKLSANERAKKLFLADPSGGGPWAGEIAETIEAACAEILADIEAEARNWAELPSKSDKAIKQECEWKADVLFAAVRHVREARPWLKKRSK